MSLEPLKPLVPIGNDNQTDESVKDEQLNNDTPTSSEVVKYDPNVAREGFRPRGERKARKMSKKEELIKGKEEKKENKFTSIINTVKNLFKKDKGDSSSAPKEIDYEKLGYPKTLELPLDVEYDEHGNEHIFFNIKKYLNYVNKSWILKIISIKLLDDRTQKSQRLGQYAEKLKVKVEEYNKMPKEKQYEADRKAKMFEWGTYAGIVAGIFLMAYMVIIPNQLSNNGVSLIRAGNYQQAFEVYSKKPSPTELDLFYKQYSYAMGLMQAKNYDKAREELYKLEGYGADYVKLNDSMNEIIYQQANNQLEEKKYAEAAENLKLIYNYKDSKEKFKEASYQSIEGLMKDEKYEDAMRMLALVGDYKDSEEIGKQFKEDLYQKAQKLYSEKKFTEAEKLFFYVAQTDYKDSKTMIYQSQYHAGLAAYRASNFEEAIDNLSKIRWFKDSSAILQDVYYKRGNALLGNNNSLAYDSLINSLTYRNTEELLKKPELAIFGSFNITAFNGSFISGSTLTIDGDYKFSTNQTDSKYVKDLLFDKPYKAAGDTLNIEGRAKLKVIVKDINNLVLQINNGKEQNELTLVRNAPISKTNMDVFSSIRDSIYNYLNIKFNGEIPKEAGDGNTE